MSIQAKREDRKANRAPLGRDTHGFVGRFRNPVRTLCGWDSVAFGITNESEKQRPYPTFDHCYPDCWLDLS